MPSPEIAALEHVAERLRSRFPQVDPATIDQQVERCHRAYDGRPIRDFVPLLVEQDVLHHLQQVPVPRVPAQPPAPVHPAARRTLEHT